MTDLKPCPSCREPLDHPSGDGCANMTAHKERAMGMAAMSDAPEQIWLGRDERYQGEPWIRLTSDFDEECETQEYIRADRIEELTKERDSLLAGHRALNIGGARLQDRAETAEAKLAECEARLGKAVRLIDMAVELARWDLNPKLRDDMIDFTAELKGESHE